jgi:cell division protein FtsI/penicillin-binding protein 2
MLVIIFYAGSWIFAHRGPADYPSLKNGELGNTWADKLVKQDLPALLRHLNLNLKPVKQNYPLAQEGSKLTIETSLDTGLQNYILKLLNRSSTFQAAVVVLRPGTGQILAMANYEKNGKEQKENLSLKANFPAASLFKIVSAAAAIEARGFTPDKPTVFRGLKHTLYKSQLNPNKGRYTRKTSFRRAFAGSINPVFGIIGIYDLGRDLMSEYAYKFLFNQAIPFDLPLDMSRIRIPEDDYGLAEIASGFNKSTLISPLHASLITAAVANNGAMIEPWLVKRVKDESGEILYRARRSNLTSPIKENTAKELRILMEDTVLRGTCRTAFRTLRRKKIFRDIDLGAKTGTINDDLDQYKYDWLTAYALPKNGDRGISITVLAVHGNKLGIRAKDLARLIINYHFTS